MAVERGSLDAIGFEDYGAALLDLAGAFVRDGDQGAGGADAGGGSHPISW